MKYITVDYIIKLHKKMIATTGGSDGIRDIQLLHSAIENSRATFDGVELYLTVKEKCASICYSIINNHSFVDGNKRMGIYVMLILLEYNGIKLSFKQEELVNLGLNIAKGKFTKDEILNWINEHE
ncbi:death on curing protein [Desulfonispora thiosulfatigenes DSM 11270]|uniref:Death on curing protein n=1 Tax=Desulfonispora thiosulfatigenes DSM 11270 TaxID=656914 RepID=A0A1W1UHV4_DESTI|nr:type II toxin-antitoxin system death-on-curing family toxin [Desulfonispora thiosulfatigenes]SMB80686.1 death on curing protein [Desulfonispora thiosulfatigenes DSM 11270]